MSTQHRMIFLELSCEGFASQSMWHQQQKIHLMAYMVHVYPKQNGLIHIHKSQNP